MNRGVKGSWKKKRCGCDKEKGCGCLSYSHIETLFLESNAAEPEAHAEHQQEIRQDRAEHGCLDDDDQVLCERNDRNDQFYCIAEGGIQKTAHNLEPKKGNTRVHLGLESSSFHSLTLSLTHTETHIPRLFSRQFLQSQSQAAWPTE